MALPLVFRRCENRGERGNVDGIGRPEPGPLAWGHMEPWYRGTTEHMRLL